MIEAVRTSETSVDNQFTRQYNPEDSSEHQSNLHCNKDPTQCNEVVWRYVCSSLLLSGSDNIVQSHPVTQRKN
jgi:hypothetical protein